MTATNTTKDSPGATEPPPKPIKRHWLKMGIELEGSWNKNFREVAQLVSGAQGKTDGSVGDGGRLPGQYPGEIITRPHTDIEKLCEEMPILWPDYVNHTCGFHIHTSFNELDTSRIADKPFWEYFLARWEAWGKQNEHRMSNDERTWFWDRLESKSEKARRYCKKEFIPLEQLEHHEKRYTAINFTAWHKYKTVEVRFLPMFKEAALAQEATKELANIFDTYLSHNEFPTVALVSEPGMEGDVVVELQNMDLPDQTYFEETTEGKKLPEVAIGADIFYRVRGAQGLMAFPDEPPTEIQEP